MGSYKPYGVCPCGWRVYAPFNDLFHIHVEVCPKCGTQKKKFHKEVARRKSLAVWNKPSTWFKFEWEVV